MSDRGDGKKKKKKDYEVGHGKPPKETQFKKGQSGNPAGRPKGSRSFSNDLKDELNERVEVSINGKKQKIRKQSAMTKTLVNNAMKGDYKAIAQVLRYLSDSTDECSTKPADQPLTPEQVEKFQRALRRYET